MSYGNSSIGSEYFNGCSSSRIEPFAACSSPSDVQALEKFTHCTDEHFQACGSSTTIKEAFNCSPGHEGFNGCSGSTQDDLTK